MAGPNNKKKSKGKSKAKNTNGSPTSPRGSSSTGAYVSDEYFWDNVENAEGLTAVAGKICEELGLPDLDSRSGLRKVHRDFDKVYKQLNALYAHARQPEVAKDEVAGAVVAIYSKLTADAVLQRRVFEEADFLSMALPLLPQPAFTQVVLHALRNATKHGTSQYGGDVKRLIAMKSSSIIQLLEDRPDDLKTAESAVCVVSHCVPVVTSNETPPDKKDLSPSAVDMPRILRVFLNIIRRHPVVSASLLDHALTLFAGAAQHCAQAFWDNPAGIDLFVAALRSPDIRQRASGVGGLLRIHVRFVTTEEEANDLQKMMSAIRAGWPPHLRGKMDSYSVDQLENTHTTVGNWQFMNAMKQVIQDHDLYALGLKIADIIPMSEYAISRGGWQVQDPLTGRMSFYSRGLPFTMWEDSLPVCAKAMRQRIPSLPEAERPAMEDKADMLDLKYLLLHSKMPEAISLARKGIKRSPQFGFFYYALTLGSDPADGLRMAKKGLKCPNLTPYLKFGMLFRAAAHAAEFALEKLEFAGDTGQALDEGYAFATSSYEDSTTYLKDAPPDSRRMKAVVYWHILVMFLVKGDHLSAGELEDAKAKLKFADDMSHHFGWIIKNSQLRATALTLLGHLDSAWREWEEIMTQSSTVGSQGHKPPKVKPDKAEADLKAWYERGELQDPDALGRAPEDYGMHADHKYSRAKVNWSTMELFRCSWCRNPSAVLKKCKGCEKATYCDAVCQGEHWKKGHRKVCGKAASKGKVS